MAAHTVSVGALRTDVAVLAAAEAAAPLRHRLDRALSELLPPLLAELCGPVLDRHDGVVRLRRLEVRLEHAGPFDESVLARLLAAGIAAALREALARPGGGVRTWPDRTAYLTAYVETRLGVVPGPLWPFAEFSALELLSPAEAVVEVLRSRPELLGPLAAAGARGGDPARLLTRLDDPACEALLAAVLGVSGAQSAADLTAIALSWNGGAGTARDPGPARTALSLVLRTVGRRPGVRALVRPAMSVAALAALHRRPPARLGRPLRRRDLVPTLAEDAVLPSAFRSALSEALRDPATRSALGDALERMSGAGAPEQTAGTSPAVPDPARPPDRTGDARTCASPVAGLVLLLPGLVSLGVRLSPAQLRAAALSTLGEEMRVTAATDPLVDALFPVDPRAALGTVPPVPDATRRAVPPEARALDPGRPGPEGWGDLLLGVLAGRLPGLRRSSRAYLQQQFLHTPGRLELTEELVRVSLDGPALAVVLAMAGLDGDQGPVPHLGGRRLTIVLTGLRR